MYIFVIILTPGGTFAQGGAMNSQGILKKEFELCYTCIIYIFVSPGFKPWLISNWKALHRIKAITSAVWLQKED